MAEESIKVAVRCRPFNQREKDKNSKLIIQMQDKITSIEDPDNSSEGLKSFTFDYSYWSHDGFTEKPDGYLIPASASSKYASQQRVFDDLGAGVLENAFGGFNCSLFAYGQTGSGKSYSMVGYGVNKGIVPVTCEVLFERLSISKDKFEVTFSMLEVYNEQVNDLLSKSHQKGGLVVRQHPSQGYFYAQDLKKVPVGSYKEIEQQIEEGTANRTVASTNMNATSSRAHTVVTITFDQILNIENSETRKSSVINLVDLAGSERADSTGATGDRLKEGANINKSLSALGNVISALADLSSGSKKKIVVPYRDSVLTKLLQNALGGNSKTIMIAALSPADINYSETISTLRYADRAKRIKTKAVVNENATEKMMRQLKEENDKLKAQLESGKLNSNLESELKTASSQEEMDKMRKQIFEELKAQMQNNQQVIDEKKTSFSERLEKAQKELADDTKQIKVKKDKKNKEPYLTNLNEDPILSFVICYFLTDQITKIGQSDDCQIKLNGLNIISEHAVVQLDSDKIILKAQQIGAKIKVNGHNVEESIELKSGDRILFGSSHLYVFINPKSSNGNEKKVTYDMAQAEIAEAKGFKLRNTTLTKEQQVVEEQIIELLPIISEVGRYIDNLDKLYIDNLHKTSKYAPITIKFELCTCLHTSAINSYVEVILVPAIAFEENSAKAHGQKVMIRMTHLQNMNSWYWDIGKLMNRRYLMQELYQRYLDGEDLVLRLKKEDDPFWEPVEDLFIGLGNFFLQNLSYRMDFEDKCYISDYKGQEIGTLNVNITPCDEHGNALDETAIVDNPEKLFQRKYLFKVTILTFEIGSALHAKGFKIKFKLFGDTKYTDTPAIENTSHMIFNYSRLVSYSSISYDHLNFFENGCITFIVYAVQKDSSPKNNILGLSTRELKIYREDTAKINKDDLRLKTRTDMDPSQIKLELSLLQRKYDILAEREKALQKLCSITIGKKNTKELDIFVNEVMKILNSKPKAKSQVF